MSNCSQERPTPLGDERSVLTELLRLYDWRFELARMEKDGDDPAGMTRLLNKYGREKKAAWDAARRVLSTQSETQRSTADRCNAAMVFKKDWKAARPMDLEPWFCHWMSELTAQGLHDKADIATVLAILSKRLAYDR